MATSYQQLKRRLQLLIDRDDATDQVAFDGESEDMLDVFIANAEKRFYRSEAARTPPFEKFINYQLASGTGVGELAIPSDYYETRYITVSNPETGIQRTLSRVSPEVVLNTTVSESVSLPSNFAYGDVKWLIRQPSVVTNVTAFYYGNLDALSTQTAAVNDHWLLNNADDLITYLAATESALYFNTTPEILSQWEARANSSHDQLVAQEVRQQQSGSTPRMKRRVRQQVSRTLY